MPRRKRPDAFNVMMRQIYRDIDAEDRQLLGINREELRDIYEKGWWANGGHDFQQTDAIEARAEFFDYMNQYGYDISDFPWEVWREDYATGRSA